MINNRLLLFLLFSFAMLNETRSATYVATGLSLTEISNAVALCASSGDTIELPAGDEIWYTYLYVEKAVSFRGAGRDQTILRDHSGNESSMWGMQTTNQFWSISDLTISAGTNSQSVFAIGPYLTISNIFRITSVSITNLYKRGIQPNGWSSGLIDNCQFTAADGIGSATGVAVFGLSTGNASSTNSPNANMSWDTIEPNWGSTNRVVVENCGFFWTENGNGAVDGYNGARFTFRFNNVTNVNIGAHGTDSSGPARGAHSWEVYGNNIYFDDGISPISFSFRGGTGIICSNTVVSVPAGGNYFRVDNYRSSGTNIYPFLYPNPCCAPYGPTTYTNVYGGRGFGDGANGETNGYPTLDQIGRTSPTTFTLTNTLQAYYPLTCWSNTYNGEDNFVFNNPTVYTNTSPFEYIPPSNVILIEGRDMTNKIIHATWEPLVYPHPLVTAMDGEGGGEEPLQTIRGKSLLRGRLIFR